MLFLLQCMSLLLAQSGHRDRGEKCLLFEGKADIYQPLLSDLDL
jgi:hypothetical protein